MDIQENNYDKLQQVRLSLFGDKKASIMLAWILASARMTSF
jgi:hypothetical protein